MTNLRFHSAFSAVAGALLLVPVVLVACSSSSDPTPATGGDAAVAETGTADTSTVDGGAGADTSTPVDSGGCQKVVNGGGVVPETAGVGAFPAAAGGAVVDGTYYMTKHEVYPPSRPDANTRRRTFVFAGGTFAAHDNDPGQSEKEFSGTFTASGSKITLSVKCPMTATAVLDYTATPTTYTQHTSSNDLFIFTKQ